MLYELLALFLRLCKLEPCNTRFPQVSAIVRKSTKLPIFSKLLVGPHRPHTLPAAMTTEAATQDVDHALFASLLPQAMAIFVQVNEAPQGSDLSGLAALVCLCLCLGHLHRSV